jgi:hypothetical protein
MLDWCDVTQYVKAVVVVARPFNESACLRKKGRE